MHAAHKENRTLKSFKKIKIKISLITLSKLGNALMLCDCKRASNNTLDWLFITNQSREVAVKTSTGLGDRESIMNIVMKEIFWLKCFVLYFLIH